MMTESEINALNLQAKKCLGLPEAERGKEDCSSTSLPKGGTFQDS
jgi:hypothetical protein